MNKYYAIAYKLNTIKDGVKTMVEESTSQDPFVFISGFGTTIPEFENQIEKLDKGQTFDFTISCSDAYGEYVPERVVDLDKAIFTINGKFDDTKVYVDAILPLQNEDGNRFMGRVLEISDSIVKIDLNHPLAGCDLNFVGTVTECREASNEEITKMINILSGNGCSGCGGGCHGSESSCGNCGEGGCGGECHCGEGSCGKCKS